MKLQSTNEFEVQVVGADSSSSFGIAMNAKAFRVLSSTLYQNKIGSIVREVSCNAVDAHIMAGTPDHPFEIHLPDMFEPWFTVRDFGVSMDHETVKKVLTQYFESTKDQSNDAIGAFGLGAKSPFSYTDTFTLTTWINGEKTVYSAYVAAGGLPKIDVMHKEASDEERGVEVKISVKREDYNTFKREVQTQLQLFPVKPVILNGSVDWIKFEWKIDNDLFKLAETQYGNRGIVISQGNVGYPIAMENLKMLDSDLLRFMQMIAQNHKMIVTFPIGQIGVTASREGIEYDDSTVENIRNRMIAVRTEMGKTVNEKLEKEINDFNRRVIYHTQFTSLEQAMIDTNRFVGMGNRWNPLTDLLQTKTVNGTVRKYHIQSSTSHRKTLKYTTGDLSIDVVNAKSTFILLKDTSNRLQKRSDQIRASNPNAWIVILGLPEGDLTAAQCDAIKAQIAKMTGGFDNVQKVSEVVLPVSEKKKYGRTGPITKFIMMDEDGRIEKISDPIDSIEGEFLWVQIDRLDMGAATGHSIVDRLRSVRELQQTNDEEVLPLIFVNERGLEKLMKLPQDKFKAEDYVSKYVAQYATESMKRKWIAQNAKSSAMARMDAVARNFVTTFDVSIDKEVSKIGKFVSESMSKGVDKKVRQVAVLVGWHYDPTVNAAIQDTTTKITEKMHNLAGTNTVFKWMVCNSWTANRLPQADLEKMFVLCAKNKSGV